MTRRIKNYLIANTVIFTGIIFIGIQKSWVRIKKDTQWTGVIDSGNKWWKQLILETDNEDIWWQKLYEEDLRRAGPFELSRTTMSAFSPKIPPDDEHLWKKNFTILHIGVHAGGASDGKVNVPAAGYRFISWERLDHKFPRDFAHKLWREYNETLVEEFRKQFWDTYRDDPDIAAADAIQCGFDSWHCLLFAPFNKKMIINSDYRFDGHHITKKENRNQSSILQDILYKMVRYNPDVILGGTNLYDVMYHQHFLGSHKIIPLPSVGEYVRDRLEKEVQPLMKEIEENGGTIDIKTQPVRWRNVQTSKKFDPGISDRKCSMQWNNQSDTILIGGKRWSKGIHTVVKILKEKISNNSQIKQKFKFAELEGYYPYCQLLSYKGVILFPYSIYSYHAVELANLGIPVFVPSVKYMARLEKDLHILKERKSILQQGTFDFMPQNERSLNYGFNPNDDFNLTALEHWLNYAVFGTWGAVVYFDSLDDLLSKLMITNYNEAHDKFVKFRIKNKQMNRKNWRSVVRYLSDGPQLKTPRTFEEGMKIWNGKLQPPDYGSPKHKVTPEETSRKWMIISESMNNYKEKDIISQVSKAGNVMYVSNNITTINIEDLKKKSDNYKLELLSVNDHKLMNIKLRNRTEINSFTREILVGSLYLIFKGVRSIQFPTFNIEGPGPGMVRYQYSDFWAIICSAIHPERTFHQFSIKLWMQRLSWFLQEHQHPLPSINDMKTKNLSKKEKYILSELQFYLKYWKTEPRSDKVNQTFFDIVDQLSFELAVQGFMRKSDAEMIRDFMSDLVTVGYTMPVVKL